MMKLTDDLIRDLPESWDRADCCWYGYRHGLYDGAKAATRRYLGTSVPRSSCKAQEQPFTRGIGRGVAPMSTGGFQDAMRGVAE